MRASLLLGCMLVAGLAKAQTTYVLTDEGVTPAPYGLLRSPAPCPLNVGGIRPCAPPAPRAEGSADDVLIAPSCMDVHPDITGTFLLVRPCSDQAVMAAAPMPIPGPRRRHHAHAHPERPSTAVIVVDRVLRQIAEAQLVASEE